MINLSSLPHRFFRALSCAGLALAASPSAQAAGRGANISGAEFGSPGGAINSSYTYNSAKTFQYFGGKGLTLLRIPILWERIQPTLNGPLDTTNLNALKQDIAWAKTYGCQVIIDIHNYARYSINSGGTYTSYIIDNVYGGSVKVSAANLANLWTALSTQFKNEPGVYAYGMMNEPHDMGTANWKTISQTVLTAIRNNGDNKLITVPGNAWTGASNWSGNNGATSWISDPANNFEYEAHCYFDHDGSGTYNETYDQELAANANLAKVGATRVSNFVNWCFTNNVHGYLGEFGIPNTDPRWLTVLDNFYRSIDAANFDGTIWAAGEWWGSYPLSVQPSNNFTTDAVQMATMLKHLANAPIVFETESLNATWTSGITHRVLSDSSLSGGAGTILDATAAGNQVTYTVPGLAGRNYDMRVGYKGFNTRGTWQLAIASALNNQYTNHGPAEDEYVSGQSYTYFDLGVITIGSSSDKLYRFTITGKNAASSGYGEAFDYITLIPQ